MAFTTPLRINLSSALRTELQRSSVWDCCDADPATEAYSALKQDAMKSHYEAKAAAVGMSLQGYCARFGIRGIV